MKFSHLCPSSPGLSIFNVWALMMATSTSLLLALSGTCFYAFIFALDLTLVSFFSQCSTSMIFNWLLHSNATSTSQRFLLAFVDGNCFLNAQKMNLPPPWSRSRHLWCQSLPFVRQTNYVSAQSSDYCYHLHSDIELARVSLATVTTQVSL